MWWQIISLVTFHFSIHPLQAFPHLQNTAMTAKLTKKFQERLHHSFVSFHSSSKRRPVCYLGNGHWGHNIWTILMWCVAEMYLQAKPSRLHCSHCDETYSLPQNGAIKLYKELRCPLDDFELVLWTSGARGKSYPLCPYCFSNPPFRDMKKGRTCMVTCFTSCSCSLLHG